MGLVLLSLGGLLMFSQGSGTVAGNHGGLGRAVVEVETSETEN